MKSTTHWQADTTLGDWLRQHRVAAIEGIDTRMLTQILREKGVMKGTVVHHHPPKRRIFFTDPNAENLVAGVSISTPVEYPGGSARILFIDCGVKLNQIRILRRLGATVIRVPWDYNPFHSPQRFDAIIISNGPGDPKIVKETIETIRLALERKIPVLGVCLGNQILALAAGANTYKLRYGHRGQNQPVQESGTKRCFITTQNHGFAVDAQTLPAGWEPWFTNLNDGTNEGIRHTKYPWMSSQFHPEATPGPTDTEWIFDYFLRKVKEHRK